MAVLLCLWCLLACLSLCFFLSGKLRHWACGRAAMPTDAELDKREDACLDAFHQLLTSAHFRLLSPDDWATAQADAFTVRRTRL